MSKKNTGIELLRQNFANVEAKFIEFFEKGQPRWPTEKRDYLRNHHQSFGQFLPDTISWERLQMNNLPGDILQETRAAFDAFKRDEEYPASAV
jgi:hypothetical protein